MLARQAGTPMASTLVLMGKCAGHPGAWPPRHLRQLQNDDRAPLLFISGGEDHLMPPRVQRSNARHHKSSTVTEVKEYPGYSHLLTAQKGWEQTADDALAWAVEHAR
jgi:pimeloyl-ACP methyl ester carboxylesterase